jgi:hypothetical protein
MRRKIAHVFKRLIDFFVGKIIWCVTFNCYLGQGFPFTCKCCKLSIKWLRGHFRFSSCLCFHENTALCKLNSYFRRIAVRQDTCAMVAISLNIQQKVHPIIWSVSNLPFDCTQAIPVRKPLGGTLVVAVNALIYLNQSVPPFGVSLNSINDISTNFPLSELRNIFCESRF